MGTRGVELFSDDTAADVRAQYRELIEDGVEDAEATQQVLESFQEYVDDEDDGPVVWLALAVSQSQVGRLSPEVRDKALSVIDAGADLERWSHDPQRLEQRRVVLAKARSQLLGAQPKRKKLRRPRMRYVTDLQPGDVLSYRASNGRVGLVRVTRLDPDRTSIAPIIKVLRYAETVVPDSEQIPTLPDRQKPDIDPPPSPSPPWWSVDWRPEGDAGIDYVEAGFRRLTNIGPKPGDENSRAWTFGSWSNLAKSLERGLLSEDV
jgi:hypothetical protein